MKYILEDLPKTRPEFIGLTETTALFRIANESYFVHIAERDGNTFPMSSSLCPDRISVIIREGKVVDAVQG